MQGAVSMAEVMQRMADNAGLELQAAERKLCEKLNALAAALLACTRPISTPQAQVQAAEDAGGLASEPMETASPEAGPSGEAAPSTPSHTSRKRKLKGTVPPLAPQSQCLGLLSVLQEHQCHAMQL